MPARIIIRLELTPAAKQDLDRACQEMGMTQVSLASRIIEWFTRQNAATRHSIVGHMPPKIYKELSRLAARKKASK